MLTLVDDPHSNYFVLKINLNDLIMYTRIIIGVHCRLLDCWGTNTVQTGTVKFSPELALKVIDHGGGDATVRLLRSNHYKVQLKVIKH